ANHEDARTAKTVRQSNCLVRRRGINVGLRIPPSNPTQFMKPDTVPAKRPPMSAHVAQTTGIARSLLRKATQRSAIACQALVANPVAKTQRPAAVNPPRPTRLRPQRWLPVRRTKRSDILPPASEPMAPQRKGRPVRNYESL